MAGSAAGVRRRGAEAEADARGGRPILLDYVDRRVGVVTNDGRVIVGRLRGFDQVCNIVLDGCVERIFAVHAGVESVPHGVYVVRGDNIAAIGEIDADRDAATKWQDVKAAPLDPVVH